MGEVHTPLLLVEEIYNLLNPMIEKKEHIDLYEPGVGPGIFLDNYSYLYKTTYNGCEINTNYQYDISYIKHIDFFEDELKTYDVMLGNLPFNHGEVHTPSKTSSTKKSKTIWTSMLKKCVDHLKPNGIGAFIIPCIWLKPDKENIYELLTSKRIHYLKLFDAPTSNKLFSYHCQTPVCYVIFENINKPELTIYDRHKWVKFQLYKNYCIPTKNIEMMQESLKKIKENNLSVLVPIKIACMKKKIIEEKTEDTTKHCILTSMYLPDKIQYFYSNVEGAYQNIPKIILAHKRLPIPYYDKEGKYGIYGRDIYIFIGDKLDILYDYLCKQEIQLMIKSFTIRMNFYEKYIFDYIVDPRKIEIKN